MYSFSIVSVFSGVFSKWVFWAINYGIQIVPNNAVYAILAYNSITPSHIYTQSLGVSKHYCFTIHPHRATLIFSHSFFCSFTFQYLSKMGSVGVMANSTKICALLLSHSVEQLVRDMYEAKAQGADVVEIRLDYINDFRPRQDLEIILKNKPLPVLIVYRPKWEGGQYEGDENMRLDTLRLAKELGADYVDLELKVASKVIEEHKPNRHNRSKIIVSCYIDGMTPSKEDLSLLLAHMQSTGADIIRLVSNSSSITELSRIFHLLAHCQIPLIAYSIGDRGLISQLLGPKFGGNLVYGSIERNPVPGLPTLHSLQHAYGVECINAETKVFGLVSKPVSHSKGPLLHNPTFRHVGYNGIYVPMLVDDLKEFFSVYSSPDFAGFSVGIPYKEAVIEFCDEVHPLAQAIGAVNTIIRRLRDGKLIGYNTDCEASITAIEDALKALGCTNGEALLPSPLTGKMFVLVGAGGAGRALAFGAKSRGAQVFIFDIDFAQAPPSYGTLHFIGFPITVQHILGRKVMSSCCFI
ncbi:bifunctional 3-dehydroquinate dehydratase/shikimate dehydrogenase, chloroplastic-like isoform X3 [Actinidia eriantha]|uniref:bifunctional 3-dehydroquinate dehydratase/shikimate dehydrogenase, chloroplastic-like isoform X3 n=1 Tax=Actinidia eriantha TaxID=165200 RepID=UPI00258761E4|nr:bifunctional 3-dehydroquinate dehydratase/shikimate dehydrogenase, chloroplastic-like isoform X3 [Actinidia eriantha]